MKTITRKTMLYKTGVEYGDYTMNHVLGCAHGCKYPCYAFMIKKRFGEVQDYADWCEPKLVSNTLDLLDAEIPKLKGKIKSVHLCFSTDPFMKGYPEVGQMSLAAIRKLNDAGIKCTVLTKGVLPIELADLSPENEYGISLVAFNQEFRERYEPNAARYYPRVNALLDLHRLGCKTWVSMEPYPTTNIIEQNIYDVLWQVNFVNKIVFGRWNYSKEAAGYKEFYNRQAAIVKKLGIECIIKRGTLTEG
ncbi:MAG: radical SAM protein [Selenomonadaceae bacterium]|nr:radical SAM protein [Selenomonadaceae bacterium]